MGEWLTKLWYIPTMNSSHQPKGSKLLIFAKIWMNFKGITLGKKASIRMSYSLKLLLYNILEMTKL